MSYSMFDDLMKKFGEIEGESEQKREARLAEHLAPFLNRKEVVNTQDLIDYVNDTSKSKASTLPKSTGTKLPLFEKSHAWAKEYFTDIHDLHDQFSEWKKDCFEEDYLSEDTRDIDMLEDFLTERSVETGKNLELPGHVKKDLLDPSNDFLAQISGNKEITIPKEGQTPIFIQQIKKGIEERLEKDFPGQDVEIDSTQRYESQLTEDELERVQDIEIEREKLLHAQEFLDDHGRPSTRKGIAMEITNGWDGLTLEKLQTRQEAKNASLSQSAPDMRNIGLDGEPPPPLPIKGAIPKSQSMPNLYREDDEPPPPLPEKKGEKTADQSRDAENDLEEEEPPPPLPEKKGEKIADQSRDAENDLEEEEPPPPLPIKKGEGNSISNAHIESAMEILQNNPNLIDHIHSVEDVAEKTGELDKIGHVDGRENNMERGIE